MNREELNRIGLLAGVGDFPRAAAVTLAAEGHEVVAIGFNGLTAADLAGDVAEIEWLDLGQLAALASRLRGWRVERLLLLGKFSRPLLLASGTVLSLDAEATRLLASSSKGSDDDLMGRLAGWLEGAGFEILDQGELLASMLVPIGPLTVRAPSDRAYADLASSWPHLDSTHRTGVGQCVVMKQGRLLATETIEGTDDMIRRAGALGAAGSTLIKATRSGQDRRFDLPAIGPDTIRAMVEAGIGALAIEADATLMLDRRTCVEVADRHGIAIWGFAPGRNR